MLRREGAKGIRGWKYKNTKKILIDAVKGSGERGKQMETGAGQTKVRWCERWRDEEAERLRSVGSVSHSDVHLFSNKPIIAMARHNIFY